MLKFSEILDGLAYETGIDPKTHEYCVNRLKTEGLSFLSVVLPSFSKHVVRCLEIGFFNHPGHPETLWSSFKLQQHGRIPLIFRVQLSGLFSNSGRVKSNADPNHLYAIRQYCEYLYKLALDFDEDQLSKAIEVYKACESTVGETVDEAYVRKLRGFIHKNYKLSELPSVDQIINKHRPRDTSGAFAGSDVLCRKVSPSEYRRTLIGTHLVPNVKFANIGGISPSPNARRFRWASMPTFVDAATCCEVLFVPKDSRGPRVISKEPLSRLRFQMSYFDFMVGHLEKVTKNRINFRDQSINRALAQQGSIDSSWATMDLKEASDRVPFTVVKTLFRHTPLFHFLSLRSPFAVLPNGEVLALKKLSGMGSGLTFPTMALIIHASVSMELAKSLPVETAMRSCYVYGDDLVVPTKYAKLVEKALTSVGLALNKNKCFTGVSPSGTFRESCGGDFYRGVDVVPVRLKLTNARLKSRRDLSKTGGLPPISRDVECVGYVKHAQELSRSNMHVLADLFYKAAERYLQIGLPTVTDSSGVLGRLGTEHDAMRCSTNIPDPVFTPDSIRYSLAESRRGFHRHDTVYRLYSSLKRLEESDDDVGPPERGISLPRRGTISLRPGCRVRRIANDAPPLINLRDLRATRPPVPFSPIRKLDIALPNTVLTWLE